MTKPESALCGALLLACAAAWAQTAPLPSASASAAEKAQKETDRTMYWIRVLADKPPPTKAATPPKPAAAVAAVPAKPAAELREKVKAATTPSTTAANAAPTRVAVGRGVDPAQGPAADPSEPSALSSNHADRAAAMLPPAEAVPIAAAEPDPGLTQIKSVRPDFPGTVIKRFHKGNVEVQFEVDPAGIVVDATVVGTSNHRLNDAALEAVKQWRFKPTPNAHTAVVNLVYDIDNEK